MLLLENGVAHRCCTGPLAIERPRIADLNRCLAAHCAAALLPAAPLLPAPPGSAGAAAPRGAALGPLLSHVCGHAGFPLCTVKLSPQAPAGAAAFDADSWSALLKRLSAMHCSDSSDGRGVDWALGPDSPSAPACVASVVALHGDGAAGAEASAAVASSGLASDALYPAWSARPRLVARCSPAAVGGAARAAALVASSQAVLRPLERVAATAAGMFAEGAYVHQYEAHGMERADFTDAFVAIEQLAQNYRGL